jgi:hypothetical protein
MQIIELEADEHDLFDQVQSIGYFESGNRHIEVERGIYNGRPGWLFTYPAGDKYFLPVTEVLPVIESLRAKKQTVPLSDL